VVERRYSNATEQEISLETKAETTGQNMLGVRILGLGRTEGDDALVPAAMTGESIAGELRQVFPGVAMQVSSAYLQNSYGPFGYAVGRGTGRDLCFYGWQRIGGEVTTPFVRQGAIDTRLRLCEAGADERALLANMYGYTVNASFGRGWSTGSPTPMLRAGIGATGVPLYPNTVEVAASQNRAPVRARAPTPAATEAPPVSPAPIAPPVGPTVPGPGGSVSAVAPFPGSLVPELVTGSMAAAINKSPRVPPPPVRIVVPSPPTGPE
jgi:hypothetical protein